MLTGLMPFHSLRDTEISYKVIQGERPVVPANADVVGISEELWRLLARCWHADSTQRPRIGEILQHLSNDPARTMIFSPPKFPPDPSCESFFESGTGKYGNCSLFKPPFRRAYSCTGDMFLTANTQAPVEGTGHLVLHSEPIDLTPTCRFPTIPHTYKSCRIG